MQPLIQSAWIRLGIMYLYIALSICHPSSLFAVHLALPVFRDRLESDFTNWSWGTYEASQSREFESGGSAMSFTPKNYSGLYLQKNGVPFSQKDYNALTLSIKQSADNVQQIRIGIGESGTNNALSTLVTIQPGGWQKLTVRFDQMENPIGDSFDKIFIQGGNLGNTGTFFVDEVYLAQLTNVPDPLPNQKPIETDPTPSNFSPAGIRALSKLEISLSMQEIFHLPSPPYLDSFHEQTSRTQLFRNSLSIVNDSANLRALDREISLVIEGINLSDLSNKLNGCDVLIKANCRERFLKHIAMHAWRRPLSAAEDAFFKDMAAQISIPPGPDQSTPLKFILSNILYDPRFLFRSELGANDRTSTQKGFPLKAWEKLSALSYSLTHRPPSVELISRLPDFEADPSKFQQLIRDYSHSPQLALMVSEFMSQWLMIHGLEDQSMADVPDWNKAKARAYISEMRQSIASSLAESGSLYSLTTTPNTVAGNQGFGIFGSRAFLTASGKNGKPSMIYRGVRLLRYALCQNLPAPPPTIDTAPPKDLDLNDPNFDEKLTLYHGARSGCKGCHSRIDPMGLALQGFDGLGANRSHKVDFEALGIKPTVTVSLAGASNTISTIDPEAFAHSLAESTVFSRCFARSAMRYVIGRDLSDKELSLADSLANQYLKVGSESQDSVANFFQALTLPDDLYIRSATANQ